MNVDAYTKFVLSVIAVCLLWLCVQNERVSVSSPWRKSTEKCWLGIDRIDPAYYTVAHGDGHSTQATASA